MDKQSHRADRQTCHLRVSLLSGEMENNAMEAESRRLCCFILLPLLQVVRFYNLDYPHKLADLVAGMSFAKRHELQAVLAVSALCT